MTFEMQMAERSLRADELVREGRAQLRQLVLEGHRRGLSQRRIAALTNRSQPEVSRLLREVSGPARISGTQGSTSHLREHGVATPAPEESDDDR